MKTVEYRVRPVTRFIVTRWHQEGMSGGCDPCGEFESHAAAVKIMEALTCHEALGVGVQPDRGEDSMGWKIGEPVEGDPQISSRDAEPLL